MKLIKALLTAALAGATLLAQAFPANLSDIWYDPAESGWGVNIVQQGDTAVVTLMVYAPGGEPTWYVASNAAAYAWSGDGLPYFRGTLYRTRGMWFGGPFDPSAVRAVPVGEVHVSPLSRDRVRIDYAVEGVAVARTVQRATWSLPPLDTPYLASFSLRHVDSDGVVSLRSATGVATLVIEDGVATMSVVDPDGRCEYRGSYRQSGRLGNFAGAFSCTDARGGPFAVDELEITANGFSGRMRAQWIGGSVHGAFGGPRR